MWIQGTGLFAWVQAQPRWTPERAAEAPFISACWVDSMGRALYLVVSAYDIARDQMRHTVYQMPYTPVQANRQDVQPPALRQLCVVDGGPMENIQWVGSHQFGFAMGNQWYTCRTDTPRVVPLTQIDSPYVHLMLSPQRNYVLFTHQEKVRDVDARDYYPQFSHTQARMYHRFPAMDAHGWVDGNAAHLFYARFDSMGRVGMPVDLMPYQQVHVPIHWSNGTWRDVSWSTDEQYIAYATHETGGDGEPDPEEATQIELYDLNDGLTTCLSCSIDRAETREHSVPIRHVSPAFAPLKSLGGSRWLAWIAEPLSGRYAGHRELILEDVHRKVSYNLTRNWRGSVELFRWSADGQSLLFIGHDTDSTGNELYQLQVFNDKQELRTPLVIRQVTHLHQDITSLAGETPHDWLVGISRWGRWSSIAAVDKDNGHVQSLVDFSTAADSLLPLREEKIFSLPEGRKIKATICYPLGFDSRRYYPLVVVLPDLPWLQMGHRGAIDELPLLASAGYVAVSVHLSLAEQDLWNPDRKHPEAFFFDSAYLTFWRAWVQQGLSLPAIDTHRVALIGFGWGGWLALQLAADGHLPISTVLLWNAITDLSSWQAVTADRWLATNGLSSKLAGHLPGLIVPTVPVLIGQGGKDGNMPSSQALALFNRLEDKHIESRLLYFPGIGHHWYIGHDWLVWQHQIFNWLQTMWGNP